MEKLPKNIEIPKYAQSSVQHIKNLVDYLNKIGFSCNTCKGSHDYSYQLAHCRNCLLNEYTQFNWQPDEEAAKITDFQRSLMMDDVVQEMVNKITYVDDHQKDGE